MPVDPECAEAAEKTGRLLESLGHDVYPVEPSFLNEVAWTAYAQTVLDASVAAMPYDEPSLVGSQLRYRMDRAKVRDSGEFVRASLLLQEETRGVVAQWGRDFDVLLTPTIAFTSFCNVTGLPAISLPVHTSSGGLPIGAQLVAGPWEEAVLVRLASALEPVVGWTRRCPALG